jgi:predicted DNA-binding transcriptional regulator YafY
MIKYINRIERINNLIASKATGCPNTLAKKMGISKRMVYKYLAVMELMGAQINYNSFRKTYYYEKGGRFNFKFQYNVTDLPNC